MDGNERHRQPRNAPSMAALEQETGRDRSATSEHREPRRNRPATNGVPRIPPAQGAGFGITRSPEENDFNEKKFTTRQKIDAVMKIQNKDFGATSANLEYFLE